MAKKKIPTISVHATAKEMQHAIETLQVIKVEAERILTIRKRVAEYYSKLSGQPMDKVLLDLDRDNFMSAQQTMEYGLIDRVI